MDVATLTGLLALLSQVDQALSQALNSGDEVAKNRINQAMIELNALMTRIQQTIEDTSNKAETMRVGVAKDATDFLKNAAAFTQGFAEESFLALNDTLLNAAVLLGNIPFVDEPAPFVLAVRPLRIASDTQSHEIQIHGYFPDANAEHPVFVSIGDRRIPTREGIGHKVVFDLPEDLLRPATFVSIVVHVPIRNGIWDRIMDTHLPISTRLYVENPQPFSFDVQFFHSNQNQRAIVRAPTPITYYANSSQTSNRQLLTAPDLFSKSINNNVEYDMATAQFVSMDAQIGAGNRPCDCCNPSSGVLEGWDINSVTFALSAPTCGAKWCNAFYFCGGGGTNAEIHLTPTFSVQRRDQPAEIGGAVSNPFARRRDALSISLPQDWTSISIQGRYIDGDDKRASVHRLTSGVPKANADLWSAEIQGGNLVISTR